MLVLFAFPGAAQDVARADGPKRVLLIQSFGANFEPYRTAAASFRTALALESRTPVEFYEVSLESARFSEGKIDRSISDYIGALLSTRPPDLVVPIASPALRFCVRQRADLFPDVPMLAFATEQRHLQNLDLGSNAVSVGFRVDLPGFVDDILRLLPATRNVYVVLGDAPLERYWAEETHRLWDGYAEGVTFTWLNDLVFADMVKRVAQLPHQSVIIFISLDIDAAGVPYEQQTALTMLHDAANAPIFGVFAHDLGRGIVGGRLVRLDEISVEAARAAVRLLNGDPASSIPARVIPQGVPVFDWRELQRWHIGADRLPPESEIRYRQPGVWEAYRWWIVGAAGFILIQGALIVLLLASAARLRSAQHKLHQLRQELAHSGRVTLVGQFAASLAHELGQPLGAILRNADTAEILLQREPLDRDELGAILADIRKDDRRAGDVIDRLRALLKRRAPDMQELSLHEVVADVTTIARPDAVARRVMLTSEIPPELPCVHADRVHVQQVLLNLISNALDALDGASGVTRSVTVEARRGDDGWVEVAVHDNGSGIDADAMGRVFNAFHTSKETGMGMGLPISRSIVEGHGGRLWAERNPDRGTTFRFTLPVCPSEAGR